LSFNYSIWELAKLVEKKKIKISISIDEWIDKALAYPGLKILNLSKEIITKSISLPGFHNDPADQLIVATSIIYDIPLLTKDKKKLEFKNVNTIKI